MSDSDELWRIEYTKSLITSAVNRSLSGLLKTRGHNARTRSRARTPQKLQIDKMQKKLFLSTVYGSQSLRKLELGVSSLVVS